MNNINLMVRYLYHFLAEEMRDFELCLYDTQPSQIGGIANEFIYSPRLDNLMMSFCSLTVSILFFFFFITLIIDFDRTKL